MPKIEIIRNGAKRSVMVDPRVAHALVKNGTFSYASEVSKPKPKAKIKDAPSRNEAEPVVVKQQQTEPAEKEETAQPEALKAALKNTTMSAGKPMTSARFTVKPTATRSREQLESMTKADLKVLGQKIGLELKPSEPKDEWVKKINRYMRRDLRAER